MDIDPEGEQAQQVAPVTPEAAPATSRTTFAVPKPRSGRRLIPFALLGILTIGAGVAAYIAVRDDTTPSDAVASALTNSLRLKSAATSTSIGVQEPGGTETITSKGVTDFDSADTTQVVHIASGNENIVEQVVRDGSTIYVHLNGGVIAKVVAGKSWLSLPSGESAASSLTGGSDAGNATATLRVLSATGNDVAALGSSLVNGQNMQIYSVHLTRSQINRDVAQEHLPQFMRQAIALVHVPAITYTLAINGANLLAQMKATLHVQAAGQEITEHLTENYSRYGAKVTVMAPPSYEVVPFETFLQTALRKDMQVAI